MTGSEEGRPNNTSLTAEDKVIVVSIVITLVLSPALAGLWFIENPIIIPPPIIGVFLGIAVSALLYRFLGGVHDASFAVGALKVTGTAAILIFVSWWSNQELEKYAPKTQLPYEKFDLEKHSNPELSTWYAVSKEYGSPIKVSFPKFDQSIKVPDFVALNEHRKIRKLSLNRNDGSLEIVLPGEKNHILGHITYNDITEAGFVADSNIEISLKAYRVVSLGSSDEVDINKDLPFLLETTGFSEDYTRFELKPRDPDEHVIESSIYLRGSKLIFYKGRHYLISIIQVNHSASTPRPYAKFYVAEISARNARNSGVSLLD